MAQSAAYFWMIVAIAVIIESNCEPECPANQVWSDCAQPRGCRPSCLQPDGAEVCITLCVADCVCKDGLILNSNGQCIKKSECRATSCPKNSTFNECPLRLSCRPSCDKPYGTAVCTRECDVRNPCVCNRGYVLNDDGECVLRSQC